VTYNGLETAETYIAVTGTWDKLRLGATFEVAQAAETSTTLYIDGENGQVWTQTADGVEVNWMSATTGDLPEIRPGLTSLYVGGENISVTMRMLVIERG